MKVLVYVRKELSENEKKKLAVDRVRWKLLWFLQKALLPIMFLAVLISVLHIEAIFWSELPFFVNVYPIIIRLTLVLLVGIWLRYKIPAVAFTLLWPKWGDFLERD